jgi:hypothetical protein
MDRQLQRGRRPVRHDDPARHLLDLLAPAAVAA